MSAKMIASLMFLAVLGFGANALAADPTVNQVYEAAHAGHVGEALQMMNQVLRDHPNSAKAHFVEAELLAQQHRLAQAKTELDTAQRIAPGLPFAKPQAVRALRERISGRAARAPRHGLPWGLLWVGIAVLLAIIYFVRSMARRNAAYLPGPGATGYGSGMPGQPYRPGGMAAPMQPGGGIGSGIMGGLATGAALGAGMVAGEALMHRFTDGAQNGTAPVADGWDAMPDDMGGSDFGLGDGGSWDDNSGGGDWT